MNYFTALSEFFDGFFLGITYSDFAIPIGYLYWSIILLIPLGNVDYADWVTGGVYVLSTVIAGIFIVLIVPSSFLGEQSFVDHMKWVSLLILFASIKWGRQYFKQIKLAEKKRYQNKSLDKPR